MSANANICRRIYLEFDAFIEDLILAHYQQSIIYFVAECSAAEVKEAGRSKSSRAWKEEKHLQPLTALTFRYVA
jgi:hypothetical protein